MHCTGVCLLLGGVCSGEGVCTPRGSRSVYSQGVSAPRGMSALGGVCLRGWYLLPGGGSVCPGGGLLWGGCIPACTEGRHPPVNRMTDRCKNITFANFAGGKTVTYIEAQPNQ